MKLNSETILDIQARRENDIDVVLLLNHIKDLEAITMSIAIERINAMNEALEALETKLKELQNFKIEFTVTGSGGDGNVNSPLNLFSMAKKS